MDIQQIIQQSTYPRDYLKCTTASSLNPAIAYALNYLAGFDEGDRILDPCCGTGTVLIERLLIKPATCIGVDINPQTLECAKENIQAANVQVELKHGDVQEVKF